MHQTTPMLRREVFHEETAWRNEALKWMNEHLAPVLEDAKMEFVMDVVPYDTTTSSIGEILVEKSTLTDDACGLVVTSSSKSRLREFFIGSVCNYCLHRCKIPVLVYKLSDREDEKTKDEDET